MSVETPHLEKIEGLLFEKYGYKTVWISHISTGLIHDTYKVQTEHRCFAFQQLHPKLSNSAVMEDYYAVTRYLDMVDFPGPELILTQEGGLCAEDDDGRWWRLSTWLPGRSYEAVEKRVMIREAARLTGQFHHTLAGIEYSFQSRHPLHDTKFHLRRLEKAMSDHRQSKWFTVMEHLAVDVLEKLPRLVLPELPLWVVHGDLKISNFLFDDTDTAMALVDLDTCTHHSVLVDLGDAMRSWCRSGKEDEECAFLLDRCELMLQGYAGSSVRLSVEERELLPQAGLLITLELASRFLADVLEDVYFGWDATRYRSRPEHNLARARGMVFLAHDLEVKKLKIERLVTKYFN